MLSVQGFSNKEIADKLCISYDTLHNAITNLLTKLGVQNLEHAGIYAMNHLLLFRQTNPDKSSFSLESPQKSKDEKNKGKKHNRKLTDEKLYRIQSCLDNKQSVNSIAEEVGIARGSIRNAIKNGKLHKNDDGNPKKSAKNPFNRFCIIFNQHNNLIINNI
jgi:DNA-binding NarL/FixJ family response regulator